MGLPPASLCCCWHLPHGVAASFSRGVNGDVKNFCNPMVEPCTDVRMFNFAADRYYTDIVRVHLKVQCAGGVERPLCSLYTALNVWRLVGRKLGRRTSSDVHHAV